AVARAAAAAGARGVRGGGGGGRARRDPAAPVRPGRRLAVLVAATVFAVVAGLVLASALGARLPGDTATGNSAAQTQKALRQRLAADITRYQDAVNASPDDYDLRLKLADAYARNNDLPTAIKQWDAAIKIDPNRPEAQASLGRALYLVSEQLSDRTLQAQYVAESVAAFDAAIRVGPDYPDSYYFRGVVRAALSQ